MRSISRRSVFAIPTVLFLVWAAGCADSESDSVGSSQISIALSASSEARETASDGGPGDPGEVIAAVVTIERIYLVGGGAAADEPEDEDDGNDDHADVDEDAAGDASASDGSAADGSAGDGSAGNGSTADGSAGDDAGRVADAGGDALAEAGSAPNDRIDAGMSSVPKDARHGKGKDERSEGRGHGGSVVLLDDPVTLELLELETFAGDLVDRAAVPADRYSQLRFVISGGYIQVSGEGIYATSGYAVPEGETVVGELRMPSYSTSGFKVALPSGSVSLAEGEHLALRVHFDVTESFGKGTGSGDWIMRPTLRATDAM